MFARAAGFVFAALLVSASWCHSVRAEGAAVLVNERAVFTLRATLDNWSPEKRAAEIAKTLQSSPFELPLQVVTKGQDLWLYSNETRIVRVTAKEAQLFQTTQAALLDQWKTSLEGAMRLPSIHLPETSVTVGVGERLRVAVEGQQAKSANILSPTGGVLDINRVSGGIEILGRKEGSYTVTLTVGPMQSTLRVQVAADTVPTPPTLSATVRGTPAKPADVSAAISQAIRDFYSKHPTIRVEVLESAGMQIPEGSTRSCTARIKVTSPQGASYERVVTVDVVNEGIPFYKESALWYCNYPETVNNLGPVFQRSLSENDAVRLLYHHANGTGQPMTMQVMAYNLSSLPAKLMLMRGDGEPNVDPVRVGLDAGDQFLRALLGRKNEVVEIPPRSVLPISVRRLDPSETMSGIAYMGLLSGGAKRVLIRTEAVPPSLNDLGMVALSADGTASTLPPRPFTINPPAMPDSDEVFGTPYKELEVNYTVGGKLGYARIGEQAIPGVGGKKSLDGNYGVLYTIKSKLENPTASPVTVQIEFEASAGYSGVVAAINGLVKKWPVVQTKEVSTLETVRLAPGESRLMNLQTIPLSGSSYPATITIRAAATTPTRRLNDTPIGSIGR